MADYRRGELDSAIEVLKSAEFSTPYPMCPATRDFLLAMAYARTNQPELAKERLAAAKAPKIAAKIRATDIYKSDGSVIIGKSGFLADHIVLDMIRREAEEAIKAALPSEEHSTTDNKAP